MPWSAAPTNGGAGTGLVAPLLAAVVVMWAFVTFPPAVAELNADASLNAVLHYAAEHDFQFGSELVSTYGPLGFLIFPHYSAHALGLRMVTDVLVCFAVAAGLCLVAWRLRWVWRVLLVGVFLWTTANVWLRTDLVLQMGLFCWGLLSLVERGRQVEVSALVYSLFAAFCGLAKVSFLFMGAAGLALLVLSLVLNGRRRLALVVVGVFWAAFFCGWIAAGQQIDNAGPFIQRGLSVALSYNAALGVEGLQSVRPAGFASAVLALGVVILRCWGAGDPGQEQKRLLWHRLLLFAWSFLFAFTIWKHGFVRGDTWHVGFFLAFVPLLMFALESVPTPNRLLGFWARVVSMTTAALPLLALQVFIFPPLPGSFIEPGALFRSNLQRMVKPGEYARVAARFLHANQRASQLPRFRQIVGSGAVDVFGQHQAYALYN
ncbi:MAG: hypothetical protein EHM39_06315, partial [Chloroflexi bacterium]